MEEIIVQGGNRLIGTVKVEKGAKECRFTYFSRQVC